MKLDKSYLKDAVELTTKKLHLLPPAKTPEPAAPRYMALHHVPASDQAKGLVAGIAAEAASLSSTRIRTTAKQRRAVGAIVSDLLRASDSDSGNYSYRTIAAASFTHQPVGRDPFDSAVDRMERLGLVRRVAGYLHLKTRKGDATRFYPTELLLERARAAGIPAGSWGEHFILALDAKPLLVMARAHATKKRRGSRVIKDRGRLMPVEWRHSRVADDARRIAELNAFMTGHKVTPMNSFSGYTRIYNNADLLGFNYDWGGRIYDLAGEYQYINKKLRAHLRINGEPLGEVDLSACHLSIIGAKMGEPINHLFDPYEHPLIEREFMKAYTSMAMGNGSLLEKWIVSCKDDYKKSKEKELEELGIDPATRCLNLSELCKAKDAKKALLELHPFLYRWNSDEIGWPQLQYEESSIMLEAMYRLAFEHGVPSLCLHDALIVPVSKIEVTRRIMAECFVRRLGAEPRIKVK